MSPLKRIIGWLLALCVIGTSGAIAALLMGFALMGLYTSGLPFLMILGATVIGLVIGVIWAKAILRDEQPRRNQIIGMAKIGPNYPDIGILKLRVPGVRCTSKTAAWVIGSLVIISIVALLQKRNRRHPIDYVLPNGYIGWVRVNYGKRTAPPLPIHGSRYLAIIPPGGLLETATNIERGFAPDRFYYQLAKNNRVLLSTDCGYTFCMELWGGFSETNADVFFIGPEEEYYRFERSPKPLKPGPIYPLKIGNRK